MMQPPGSFPGINSFAMAPMTRPMTKTQMIECALKSIWEAILTRELKLVNLAVVMLMAAFPEPITRSEEGFNEFLTIYGSV